MKFLNTSRLSSLLIVALLTALTCGAGRYCAGQELQQESGQEASMEYKIKAAFIFNFLKSIEWRAGVHTEGKLAICIIGANPFGGVMENLSGKTIAANELVVRHFDSYRDVNAKECHVIFISPSEKGNLDDILKTLAGPNVLTISDTDGFGKRGVMINFYMSKNKVRFEINLKAAKRAGVKISSKLLRLGKYRLVSN